MTKETKTITRYSISFKQKVVSEIELEGLTFAQARRRYGIKGGATIRGWLELFGKTHLLNTVVRIEMKGEKDKMLAMEKEIIKLKVALADAYLERDCAETVIRLAGEIYQTDLKKKFGGKPSGSLGKSTA